MLLTLNMSQKCCDVPASEASGLPDVENMPGALLPSPSWPCAFAPQHTRSWLEVSAHAASLPTTTEVSSGESINRLGVVRSVSKAVFAQPPQHAVSVSLVENAHAPLPPPARPS